MQYEPPVCLHKGNNKFMCSILSLREMAWNIQATRTRLANWYKGNDWRKPIQKQTRGRRKGYMKKYGVLVF